MSEMNQNINFKTLDEVNLNFARSLNDIHLENLPDDVMPNFGPKFMENYIRFLNQNSNGTIIVAYHNTEIVGFLCLRLKQLYPRKLLNFRALLYFLNSSRKKPRLILNLIHQLLNTNMKKQDTCEIDFFVVSKNYTSKGIGKDLLMEAESYAKRNSFTWISTKTKNPRLFEFYLRVKLATVVSTY
jgi:GNAT superfamily N-acetyltransferase